MLALDLVQNAFDKAKQAPQSDDGAALTHFDKIVTYIEQEKIDQATALIEQTFAKGVPDIRLVVYYFYAQFLETGIKSFNAIFPSLIEILTDQWDLLRPLNRKDKQVQNSLNWFISQIIGKLKYCEKLSKSGKNHPLWDQSVLEIAEDEIENVILSTAKLHEFFIQKWPKSPTNERLLHLISMLEGFKQIIPKANVEKVEEIVALSEPESVETEENEIISEVDEEPVSIIEELVEQLQGEETPIQNVTQELSAFCDQMHSISNKLRIFEVLIQKNEFVKAALVAKDIDHTIANFDPLLYFPKLFSNYLAIAARNVPALAEQWNNESLQSKYLEKLYRTDLEKFLEW